MADVLYVIRHIPGNDAPTTRVSALITLLARNGYSVDLMTTSWENSTAVDISTNQGAVRLLRPLRGIKKPFKISESITSARAIRAATTYIEQNAPRLIIFYGGTSRLVRAVHAWHGPHSPAVVVDETDWFDPRAVQGWHSRIYYYLDNLRIETIDEHINGQIVISPYFRRYFEDKGCRPYFLPPVFPISHASACSAPELAEHKQPEAQRPLTMVYAGSLGNGKDLIVPFVEAVRRHNASRTNNRITFIIVGPDWNSLLDLVGGTQVQHARDGIRVMGKQAHDNVLRLLENADFSVLLRPDQQFARAGFSTKFAESMICGTPVICNRVGGADSVLDDWVDGVVLDTVNPTEITDALAHLSELPSDVLRAIQENARLKGRALFDLSAYTDSFGHYLTALLSHSR